MNYSVTELYSFQKGCYEFRLFKNDEKYTDLIRIGFKDEDLIKGKFSFCRDFIPRHENHILKLLPSEYFMHINKPDFMPFTVEKFVEEIIKCMEFCFNLKTAP